MLSTTITLIEQMLKVCYLHFAHSSILLEFFSEWTTLQVGIQSCGSQRWKPVVKLTNILWVHLRQYYFSKWSSNLKPKNKKALRNLSYENVGEIDTWGSPKINSNISAARYLAFELLLVFSRPDFCVKLNTFSCSWMFCGKLILLF
jgi:hypothetical protein